MKVNLHRKIPYWIGLLLILIHYGDFVIHDSHRPWRHHYDEPNWIWIGVETWRVVEQGDWDSPFWLEAHSGWGLANPQLGKYFIGAPAAWYLDRNPDIHLHRFGNFGEGSPPETWPPPELYYPARLQAALFTMLAAMLLLDLTASTLNGWTGLIATILFIRHPYVDAASFHAMTDACALFGTAFAFWAVFRKNVWAAATLGGLGLGFAAATRLNGWLIAPALLLGLWLKFRRDLGSRKTFGALAIPIPLALAMCFATNPVLWRAPVEGWSRILRAAPDSGLIHGMELGTLVDIFPAFFFEMTFSHDASPAHFAFCIVLSIWLALGLATLVKSRNKNRRLMAQLAITIWTLAIVTLPNVWDRYFLPGVLAQCPIQAYGAWLTIPLARSWIKRTIRRARKIEHRDPQM